MHRLQAKPLKEASNALPTVLPAPDSCQAPINFIPTSHTLFTRSAHIRDLAVTTPLCVRTLPFAYILSINVCARAQVEDWRAVRASWRCRRACGEADDAPSLTVNLPHRFNVCLECPAAAPHAEAACATASWTAAAFTASSLAAAALSSPTLTSAAHTTATLAATALATAALATTAGAADVIPRHPRRGLSRPSEL